MFSSALKSFASNIQGSYDVSKQPIAASGVWRIFDAKKKSTGSDVSVFVFDRKSLDANASGFGARSSGSSLRKVHDEVIERLKREASNLARLRHPSVLQLVEPMEETRSGGLMFATEPVTASLATLLAEKDDQERHGGVGGRSSRFVVEEADGTRRRRDVEMDELEIQKGLLQVAKGLEFLHESAKLVHGNLTPNAIYVNAKSDWKISGLAFAGPPDNAEGHQSLPPLSLSEALYHDPRLPRTVQLNLDYTSPDFVLDSNISVSHDVYSLGLITVALYNSPHDSPLQTNGNQQSYKKIFGSSSTTPSPGNRFGSSRELPTELMETLPRLLSRRPAQRITARDFQTSAYFNNTLVNAIRFMEELPTKTPNEKAQFMRMFKTNMNRFPSSVLGKKVLGVMLDELKDKDLLSLVLQNIFQIVKTIPSGRRAFSERVIPQLREVFLTKSTHQERDPGKEAGLVILLENAELITKNCSAKEFKDNILPIVHVAMESPTHSLVDRALTTLPSILPVLDFSTVKHDLFPVVASVFSKTNSLGIKISGLDALGVLCGAPMSNLEDQSDDFSGVIEEKKANKEVVTALDKYTVQEKVVPLLKGIKTKEPAVMMAALKVFQRVGAVADTDFLALEVLPTMWSFSLGPLLDLQQFKEFMDLIKKFSSRIEREQTRKLQELSSNAAKSPPANGWNSVNSPGLANGSSNGQEAVEQSFEQLVLGRQSQSNDVMGRKNNGWPSSPNQPTPTFGWSSMSPTATNQTSTSNPPAPTSRSITPDASINIFPSLQPSNAASRNTNLSSSPWSAASKPLSPPPNSQRSTSNPSLATLSSLSSNTTTSTGFSIPPPPSSNANWKPPNSWGTQNALSTPLNPTSPVPATSQGVSMGGISQRPQYGTGLGGNQSFGTAPPQTESAQRQQQQQQRQQQQPQKSGLDKYQSLL
ncbi:MAG: hypothetical protein Q9227_006467 [Pyrenula ochraceoflavens]